MRRALSTLSAFALLAVTTPLRAQTVPIETRVDRIEKELKAVQRKVFPGGAPVQPDVTAPVTTPDTTPSSTPVADLIARVDALETQVAGLTGQVEQSTFRLKQLEDGFARYKADMDARLGPAPAALPAAAAPVAGVVASSSSPSAPPPAPKPAAAPAKPPRSAPTTAAGEARKVAVAAIERPDTGSAADDAYNYGYRLWEARFLPEAQVQLKATVEQYGATTVGSRAQNLLGRAYLDDGKPALASVAFYENYQKRPRGDRAADSLAYLGEALIQLKKPADACKVYDQLDAEYGTSLSPKLRDMMQKGKVRAKCGA